MSQEITKANAKAKKQIEAHFEIYSKVLGGKVSKPTAEQSQAIIAALTEGLEAGTIAMTEAAYKTHAEKGTFKTYAKGLHKNWLKKDKRICVASLTPITTAEDDESDDE